MVLFTVPNAQKLVNIDGEDVEVGTSVENERGVTGMVYMYDMSPGEHATHMHENGECDTSDLLRRWVNSILYGTRFNNPKECHARYLSNFAVN